MGPDFYRNMRRAPPVRRMLDARSASVETLGVVHIHSPFCKIAVLPSAQSGCSRRHAKHEPFKYDVYVAVSSPPRVYAPYSGFHAPMTSPLHHLRSPKHSTQLPFASHSSWDADVARYPDAAALPDPIDFPVSKSRHHNF